MTQNNLACEWQLYHLIWWKILDFLCSFQSPSESNLLIIYIYILRSLLISFIIILISYISFIDIFSSKSNLNDSKCMTLR